MNKNHCLYRLHTTVGVYRVCVDVTQHTGHRHCPPGRDLHPRVPPSLLLSGMETILHTINLEKIFKLQCENG